MEYWFVPKCPFKLVTGLDCPGCGFQRALHALLHGKIAEAVRYNLFLLYAIPYLVMLVITAILPQCRIKATLKNILEHKYVVYFYIIAFIVWFAVRNIFNL